MEHQLAAHRGGEEPKFKFKVVKTCRTALERQVREAVRINLRGAVLNKKGMYNRCKLTRMVLDTEWEDKVWEESWQYSSKWEGEQTESDQDLQESSRLKRKKGSTGPRKRAKLEAEHRTTWGETISTGEQETITFLLSSRETPQEIPKVKSSQRRMKVFTGVEWMARELLLKVADGAADLGMEFENMKEWPDWKEDKPAPVFRKRSKKEEKQLQKMVHSFS